MSQFSSYTSYRDTDVKWLGSIPEHWDLTRVKYVSELTPKKPMIDGDLECSFIPMEKLKTDTIILDESRTVKNVYDGYTYFADQDILMAKVTPCFENKNIAVASNLKNGIGFGSSEIYVIRTNLKADSRYLFYRLQEDGFMEVAIAAMTGAGGLRRVPSDTVNNFLLALPSTSEQRCIAAFLDHETAKIDTLIEKQQQLIKLLKEKRQAVISHAVTKGLNPNAPMKDSGVEWLGEVPEHWRVTQFRHVMTGGTRNGLYKPEGSKSEEGAPFIQMGEAFADRVFTGKTKDRVLSNKDEIDLWGLKEGDLLFARRSLVLEGSGKCTRIGKISEPHIFESSMIRVRPNSNRISAQYLHFLLDSEVMRAQLLSTTKTVTISGIDSLQLKSLRLPLPPFEEQVHTCAYLDNLIAKIDNTVTKSELSMSLLKERRTALISAAVTGKIDVRNFKADSADAA